MVSTSPIPFAPITRQDGNNTTDTPSADAVFATQVDANFTAINNWAATVASLRNANLTQAQVATLNANYNTAVADGFGGVFGRTTGDLRMLSIRVKYIGAAGLTAAADGSVPMGASTEICTLIDSRFVVATENQRLYFPAHIDALTGAVLLAPTGKLYLASLGYAGYVLPVNATIAMALNYIVR